MLSSSRAPKAESRTHDEAPSLGRVVAETAALKQIAADKTRSIQAITGQVKMLALNALDEQTPL
jgi:hypothetical protein